MARLSRFSKGPRRWCGSLSAGDGDFFRIKNPKNPSRASDGTRVAPGVFFSFLATRSSIVFFFFGEPLLAVRALYCIKLRTAPATSISLASVLASYSTRMTSFVDYVLGYVARCYQYVPRVPTRLAVGNKSRKIKIPHLRSIPGKDRTSRLLVLLGVLEVLYCTTKHVVDY